MMPITQEACSKMRPTTLLLVMLIITSSDGTPHGSSWARITTED